MPTISIIIKVIIIILRIDCKVSKALFLENSISYLRKS